MSRASDRQVAATATHCGHSFSGARRSSSHALDEFRSAARAVLTPGSSPQLSMAVEPTFSMTCNTSKAGTQAFVNTANRAMRMNDEKTEVRWRIDASAVHCAERFVQHRVQCALPRLYAWTIAPPW